MNNNRNYGNRNNGRSGYSGQSGYSGLSGQRGNAGRSRNPGSTGNARTGYPRYSGNTGYAGNRRYNANSGYNGNTNQTDYARHNRQSSGYDEYDDYDDYGDYSNYGSRGRSRPQSDGYDNGYGGYGRTNPPRTGGSGNGRRPVYESFDDEEEDTGSMMPLIILSVLTVVILIVILIVVSTSLLGKSNPDKNRADTQTSVSDGDNGQATVIGFDDNDEDGESDETSSEIEYKNFLGNWNKTDVYESRKATVTVNGQYDDSFEFTLEMWYEGKSASVTGTAFFTDESTAVFKKGAASITLEQGQQYLTIYHSGKNKAFGIADGYEIDGKFTKGTPNYIKEAETVGYDYHIYQSDAVVKALSATLSAEDYALYREMMDKGLKSPIPYERTLDKNGKKVNVDTQLNAVKYYAYLSSIAADMIFICSNDAKIYVLFYDTEEMRYYTNDKAYATQMPASFQAVEKANNQKAVFK